MSRTIKRIYNHQIHRKLRPYGKDLGPWGNGKAPTKAIRKRLKKRARRAQIEQT